jgi:hypothetical protein
MAIEAKARQLQQLANLASRIADELIEELGKNHKAVDCMLNATLSVCAAKAAIEHDAELKPINLEPKKRRQHES